MKRWLTLRSSSRQVPSHHSHSRRTALLLEQLEDRLVPAQYAFSSAGDSLQIHLGTDEAVQVSESGGDVTFTLNTGTFTQTGVNVATGDGTSSIIVPKGDLVTTLAIDNQPAGAGTNHVTFSDTGSVSTALFSVNLSAGDSAALGTISFGGGFDVSATSEITLTTPRNISVGSGTALSVSGSGSITMNANQQVTPTGGTFIGIDVDGATLTTTGSGTISLRGAGGNSGGGNTGIQVRNAAVLQSTATDASAGKLSLDGTGGSSGAGANPGLTMFGMSSVTSVGGAIELTGHGGAGADFSFGIHIVGAVISSTGVGAQAAPITLDGTGGAGGIRAWGTYFQGVGTQVTSVDGDIQITGQGGGGSGFGHFGVLISGAVVSSTGTGSDAANITISGTGGTGSGNLIGVLISQSGGTVATVDGDIRIIGQGGAGTANFNPGVELSNGPQIISTGTGSGAGTITLDGTGGTGTTELHGVRINDASRITTVDGAVHVTGTAGTGPGDAFLLTSNSRLDVTGTAPVTLIGDSMVISSSSTLAAGMSTVTLRPETAGTAIDLGGGDAAGVLGLTNDELNRISADTIQIGDGNSGPITVSAPIVFDAPPAVASTTSSDPALLDGRFVQAIVERDASDNVIGIGIKFAGDLVRNLPSGTVDVHMPLPLEAGSTPFTHVEIGFDADGHPPPGIYTFPHFDFHFYTIDEATREAIPGGPPPMGFDPAFLPPGYLAPAGQVPEMGSHSYDGTGPEWNGGVFTKTFLYGFFNNALAFLEPAATPDYFLSLAAQANPTAEFEIRQPALYPYPTLPILFPTRWEVSYNADTDEYTVSIRQFVSVPLTPVAPTHLVLQTGGTVALNADIDTDNGDLTVDGSRIEPANGVTVTTGSGLARLTGGRVNVGASPGATTVAGTLVLDSNILEVDLAGPTPGTDHDQFVAIEGVTLSNDPKLDPEFLFTPAVGQSFTIVDNQSGNAVNGTFFNRPEGALFLSLDDGILSQITYQGGDGNDVVLTVVDIPANLVVDNTGDAYDGNFGPGQQTLREAITRANFLADANTITFDETVFGALQIITLAGAQLPTLTREMSIVGPGANLLTIDAADLSRHFEIAAGASVELSGLRLIRGQVGNTGGGSILNHGLLNLSACHLEDNHTVAGGFGGAIENFAVLTLSATTLNANSSDSLAGALYNSGTALVINSTFSGNTAQDEGGAIFADSPGPITICNSTIVNNRGDNDGDDERRGGGIGHFNGPLTLENTLVAGNRGGTPTDDVPNDIDSVNPGEIAAESSHNLIGDPNSSGGLVHGRNGNIVGDGTGNLLPTASIIDLVLADNGGPTPTHALANFSPVLDAGDDSLIGFLANDQRGAGFARTLGMHVDIGAVESASHFTDSFTGPDADDLGDDYTLLHGQFRRADAAVAVTGTKPAHAVVNELAGADVAVEADVNLAGAGSRAGLIARYNPAQGGRSESYYWARLIRRNGRVRAQLLRYRNGIVKVLADRATDLGGNEHLRFEVVGAALKLFVNGELVVSAQDRVLSQSGQVGIRARHGATLDNLQALPLPAALTNQGFSLGSDTRRRER